MLNTGEIADLYLKEDYERMEASLSKLMKELGIPLSKDNIYKTYIKQIKKYFHIVLSMSPVGD